MAWTTPRTYTTGELISAAMLNTDHRDNLLYLFGVAAVMPWIVDVDVMTAPQTNVNWSTYGTTAAQYPAVLQTSTTAQNNEITYPLVIGAGTWKARLTFTSSNDSGIFNIQFDGVTVATVDAYAAAGTTGAASDSGSFVVAASAKVTLKIIMATKNASSSAYRGNLAHIQFVRTA